MLFGSQKSGNLMEKGERVIQVIWPVVLSFKIQTAKCHAQSIGYSRNEALVIGQ